MNHGDMIAHLINEIGYLFIAAQFGLAFIFSAKKKGAVALMLFCGIFLLCGITRMLEFLEVLPEINSILIYILPAFTWFCILTNRPRVIVESMKPVIVIEGKKHDIG